MTPHSGEADQAVQARVQARWLVDALAISDHRTARNDDGMKSRPLEVKLGFGFGAFGGAFTGTPNVGFGLSESVRDLRLGWRLTSAVRRDPELVVNLDATRRESANGDVAPEHGVMLRGALRW